MPKNENFSFLGQLKKALAGLVCLRGHPCCVSVKYYSRRSLSPCVPIPASQSSHHKDLHAAVPIHACRTWYKIYVEIPRLWGALTFWLPSRSHRTTHSHSRQAATGGRGGVDAPSLPPMREPEATVPPRTRQVDTRAPLRSWRRRPPCPAVDEHAEVTSCRGHVEYVL